MIFASDLDRTLVYSKVFLEPHLKNIVVVETLDNKDISHITERSINLLQTISEKILFVPVTTRSREQYNRIQLLKKSILPKYAVVANGGIILEDGKVDLHWKNIIKEKLKSIIDIKSMEEKCKFFLESKYVSRYKFCEELFIYCILGNPKECGKKIIDRLSITASQYGYTVSKQGRKVYIVPNCINKWDPLEYIMEKESENKIAAAGDSLLDLPMLKHAKHSIVPKHGELYKSFLDPCNKNNINFSDHFHDNFNITKNTGLLAGEEILENILKLIA